EMTLRISFSNSRQVHPGADSSDWRNESAVVPTATRTDEQTYERVFKIPQPTNDVDLLFRMLQTHLENFKSKHPIVAVALTAQPIRPASQQFGLFETALRNPQQLYETLARLSALLGSDRVGTPIKEETHRPDAFRMEPFTWSLAADSEPEWRLAASTSRNPSSSPSPQNGESPSRTGRIAADSEPEWRLAASTEKKSRVALRRFRPATAASLFTSEDRPASRPKDSHFAEVAGSPSSFYLAGHEQRVIPFEGAACETQVRRHLESAKLRGQIVDQAGPFLLSGNWWDEKSWARAEYDMQLENGDLVRAHESEGVWKIDGIYD